ncbi:hypothetical protein D779_2540 [Imhoffiella purpurea]|uniref:Uncharacterized protein n=1 Tax=Imhoffiella purpurea TaxID=1249627 RepID=W9V517_9GAMM|nr:hypothetical protein D779_2540 [Imhoffiella purpurea]
MISLDHLLRVLNDLAPRFPAAPSCSAGRHPFVVPRLYRAGFR